MYLKTIRKMKKVFIQYWMSIIGRFFTSWSLWILFRDNKKDAIPAFRSQLKWKLHDWKSHAVYWWLNRYRVEKIFRCCTWLLYLRLIYNAVVLSWIEVISFIFHGWRTEEIKLSQGACYPNWCKNKSKLW